MTGNIIIFDEKNKELYNESNLYENVVEEIVSQLTSFIRFNPDDLSKELLKKVVRRGFSNTPKKTFGPINLQGERELTIHLGF